MRLIFIGGFFPKQFIASFLSKSKLQVQNAANSFQWAFIKGLEQNSTSGVTLITAPFLGWYPRYYKNLFVKTAFFSDGQNSNNGIMVGFLNLPVIKNVFKYYKLYRFINNSLQPDNKTVLFVYSPAVAYLKAALKAKHNNPNTIVCLIITDLPEISHVPNFKLDYNIFFRWYREYFEKPISYKLLNRVDCYVVLSDKMVDFLDIHRKPWIRLEGIYDDLQGSIEEISGPIQIVKIILYTGSLNYSYGIKELLDAFKLITSKDYRLWICGGGAGHDLVKTRAAEDIRIEYFGIVSKQKVRKMQHEATILVNPRNTMGEYNKYSFPSKTIEYLASGTPTLMYKLEGVPLEYFDYCYTVKDNSIKSLAHSIYTTCQLDNETLKIKGEQAKDFIIKNKNSKVQCRRVLDMIESM